MLDILATLEKPVYAIYAADGEPMCLIKAQTGLVEGWMDQDFAFMPCIYKPSPWGEHRLVVQLTTTCPAHIVDSLKKAVAEATQ